MLTVIRGHRYNQGAPLGGRDKIHTSTKVHLFGTYKTINAFTLQLLLLRQTAREQRLLY